MWNLKPNTLQLLDSFQYFDWFSTLGEPILGKIVQPRSLEEALKYLNHYEWANAWNDQTNQLTHCIRRSLGDTESNRHNELVAILNARYIEPNFPDHPLVKLKKIKWNIWATFLRLGFESEYSHICFDSLSSEVQTMYDAYLDDSIYEPPKPFATELAYWYMRGHFPCGWIGDYPRGKLVVY
jgi:hypothetical protein